MFLVLHPRWWIFSLVNIFRTCPCNNCNNSHYVKLAKDCVTLKLPERVAFLWCRWRLCVPSNCIFAIPPSLLTGRWKCLARVIFTQKENFSHLFDAITKRHHNLYRIWRLSYEYQWDLVRVSAWHRRCHIRELRIGLPDMFISFVISKLFIKSILIFFKCISNVTGDPRGRLWYWIRSLISRIS